MLSRDTLGSGQCDRLTEAGRWHAKFHPCASEMAHWVQVPPVHESNSVYVCVVQPGHESDSVYVCVVQPGIHCVRTDFLSQVTL